MDSQIKDQMNKDNKGNKPILKTQFEPKNLQGQNKSRKPNNSKVTFKLSPNKNKPMQGNSMYGQGKSKATTTKKTNPKLQVDNEVNKSKKPTANQKKNVQSKPDKMPKNPLNINDLFYPTYKEFCSQLKTWEEPLKEFLYNDIRGNFKNTFNNLKVEYERNACCPEYTDIFNCFKLTNFDSLKAVIIGLEPCDILTVSNGLAFSSQKRFGVTLTANVIYTSIEMNQCLKFIRPNHSDLSSWASNGILLLNCFLTVKSNEKYSHRNIGWTNFVDFVIKTISVTKEKIIFFLWGLEAKLKEKLIDKSKHLILSACDPNPDQLHTRELFSDYYKQFIICNEYLKKNNLPEIDWSLDN